MASYLSKLCTASLLLMLFSSPCLAVVSPSIFNSPETICNSTPHPSFCKSMLRPNNRPSTIFDYGRSSIHQSISTAKVFISLLNKYLKSSSKLSQSTIGALQDCQFLAELNQEFLINTLESVNNANSTLHSPQAEDLHTRLSAVLTNQETCLDGIQATFTASSIKNSLSEPIQNGTKSYSVSLALFTDSWGTHVGFRSRRLRERKLITFSDTRNQKEYGFFRRSALQKTPVIGNVSVSRMVVVNHDGTGNFTTINDAVKAAPNNTKGSSYFVIYVVAGVYKEYVSIPSNKKYIMMIGDGINRTIITGSHSVAGNWTTFNSATFAVVAQGFVAVNITFRNTAGAIQNQAVALRNGADLSVFYKCSFEGYQDTLYTHSQRQLYRECDIYGTVDFIFGNAAVVFQNCNIYSRLPLSGQFNAITAQGRTDPNQNTGTSIQGCRITASRDLATSNRTIKTYLGRPWKEYSRTVYMQSFIDRLIDPSGWREWSGNFALSTLYYAEFNNTGPGSNTFSRVTWPGYHVIKAGDAVNFTVSNFILGNFWLPATAVPYTSGFIGRS